MTAARRAGEEAGGTEEILPVPREETGIEAVHGAQATPAPEPAGSLTGEAGDPEALRKEIETLRDRFLRCQAEFDNFRKRTRREMEEMEERAAARLVTGLLEVLDSLERGLRTSPRERAREAEGWREGMELVARQFRDCLAREGVEEVPGEGAPFDPEIHEAVVASADPVGEGRVIEVYRKGYRHRGRLLRPAQVKVGGPWEARATSENGDGGHRG